MRLQKTRKARDCHNCKAPILKGDLYGKKSITLGPKKDDMTEVFDRTKQAFVIHQMRIQVCLCSNCSSIFSIK